jgi:hypothetical protein
MLIEVKCLEGQCEIVGWTDEPLKLTGPGESAIFDPETSEIKIQVVGETKVEKVQCAIL